MKHKKVEVYINKHFDDNGKLTKEKGDQSFEFVTDDISLEEIERFFGLVSKTFKGKPMNIRNVIIHREGL